MANVCQVIKWCGSCDLVAGCTCDYVGGARMSGIMGEQICGALFMIGRGPDGAAVVVVWSQGAWRKIWILKVKNSAFCVP